MPVLVPPTKREIYLMQAHQLDGHLADNGMEVPDGMSVDERRVLLLEYLGCF